MSTIIVWLVLWALTTWLLCMAWELACDLYKGVRWIYRKFRKPEPEPLLKWFDTQFDAEIHYFKRIIQELPSQMRGRPGIESLIVPNARHLSNVHMQLQDLSPESFIGHPPILKPEPREGIFTESDVEGHPV